MKVSMDPGSMTQDPNESQKHIENFNNAIGTAKALDPVSVKAFENTAGKKGIILYDPHISPRAEDGVVEEKAPTYLPTHIFDREYDPQRTSLIQHLRAKAIESAINSSNADEQSSSVPKVASPEGSGVTGPQPQQTNEASGPQASLPPLDTEIKNKLRQTTSGLIQKQMQLIESNSNVKKSVLSQLANQGLIAGHTPSTIAKITNPQDISLLYQRITAEGTGGSAAGGAMKKFIQGIAAKQLGDRIRSYPGTDLQVLLKNRNDRSDATGILEKLAETLTYLSQISTTKGSPAANQNTNKGGSPQATQGKTNGPISK